MRSNVVDLRGSVLRTIDLDDRVFGITPNQAVVHQAVVTQQANARQGTHDTRTRGEVAGAARSRTARKAPVTPARALNARPTTAAVAWSSARTRARMKRPFRARCDGWRCVRCCPPAPPRTR